MWYKTAVVLLGYSADQMVSIHRTTNSCRCSNLCVALARLSQHMLSSTEYASAHCTTLQFQVQQSACMFQRCGTWSKCHEPAATAHHMCNTRYLYRHNLCRTSSKKPITNMGLQASPRILQCEVSQCRHPDQHSGRLITQTELVTSPCVPLHIRVPVHDLIFALEPLFAAEGRSCPSFFRYNGNSYTDSCLCLIARDQQHSAQNKHPNSANIANSSLVSTAQTGLTAQPCIHAERKLIASSFTVGDDIKPRLVVCLTLRTRQGGWGGGVCDSTPEAMCMVAFPQTVHCDSCGAMS